jgi:hypothetical protein
VLARVKQRRPNTGEIALHLDPRTSIPFADGEAYKILTDLPEHGCVWSPELGCYMFRRHRIYRFSNTTLMRIFIHPVQLQCSKMIFDKHNN